MQDSSQLSFLRLAAVGLITTALVGCVTSTPTIDTSPTAELSFDGLSPVKGGRMDAAWARTDFSLQSYSKVMLQGIGIEYRPDGESRRRTISTSKSEHFEITPQQKELFQAAMREVLLEEMAKGEHFKLVTEPGSDVLLVRVGLLDVASFVPPDPVGNADIYLSRVGEATLVLELRDSVTEAILLRGVDRRAAEDASGLMTESNRAMNTAEVRRLARTWAIIVRDGLDHYMSSPAAE